MDDTQRIVKCGNLSLHSPGGFFKKRWHSKYLVLYDGSKSGVKRLELFESEIKFKKQNPVKIIPLVDCVRIVTCQRHKTTFTFEVRTSDQFYLLASKSFQDMNDWVNCLRLVAFGQQQQPETGSGQQRATAKQQLPARDATPIATNKRQPNAIDSNANQVDVLLSRQQTSTLSAASEPKQHSASAVSGARATTNQLVADPMTSAKVTSAKPELRPQILTASQAAETAASALAKARQRQPSLLGSCKPQPPDDSPFIKQAPAALAGVGVSGAPEQMDTLTPTVRGQLIAAATSTACKPLLQQQTRISPTGARTTKQPVQIGPALDEEEENMLYCSIEDNPSEHNYRVKVIETELALRCQLKCYQLTGSTTISQQYEELAQFRLATNHTQTTQTNTNNNNSSYPAIITFYQLIIGPQELTLLNDYATSSAQARATLTNSKPNQQGLWSWPYQCIRRYGFDKDNCFMFEAGRKCTSGPGQFVVQTPKAYNIYQDVVKFVNELRTINAGGPGQRPIAMTQAQTNDSIQMRGENQLAKQLTVTQIPVIWTPNGAGANANTNTEPANTRETFAQESHAISDVVASRRQFFDGLRRSPDRDHPLKADGAKTEAGKVFAAAAAVTANAANNCSTGTRPIELNKETSTQEDQSKPPPRPPPMKLTSRTPPRGASQEQMLQKRPQLSSMSSCASDETDESGYEQGDDSVDSGSSSQHKQPEQLESRQAASRVTSCGGLTTNSNSSHESEHSSSNLSSAASSCSPASSASNSPGQSISRRTADLMSNNSMGSGGGSNGSSTCQSSTRPRLPLLSELTRARPKTSGNTIASSERDSTSNLHSLLTASLLDDGRGPKSETQTGVARPASVIKSLKANRYDDDFETSLIRDVYSEISKLHAQFAVTTTGAEDSLSSGGESAAASSSSLENNSEVMRPGEGDDNSQSDLDDLMGRNPAGDEQEPMYSNLRTVAELNSARRSEEERGTSERHHQIPNQPMRPVNTNRLHFHDPIRPPPLYPSMLNPIPEIAEHQQNSAQANPHQDQRETSQARDLKVSTCQNQTQRQLLKQDNYSAELDKSMDLPRARLALDRKAIKKSQQSVGSQQCQQPLRQKSASHSMGQLLTRPTNHYLINDVQYAKISRNMASVDRNQHQGNVERRR